jgi:hypothetical protein
VVSSMPRPLFNPGKHPVPIVQEAGWAPRLVWTGGKSCPLHASIPGPSTPLSVAIPTELPGPPNLLHMLEICTCVCGINILCILIIRNLLHALVAYVLSQINYFLKIMDIFRFKNHPPKSHNNCNSSVG